MAAMFGARLVLLSGVASQLSWDRCEEGATGAAFLHKRKFSLASLFNSISKGRRGLRSGLRHKVWIATAFSFSVWVSFVKQTHLLIVALVIIIIFTFLLVSPAPASLSGLRAALSLSRPIRWSVANTQ